MPPAPAYDSYMPAQRALADYAAAAELAEGDEAFAERDATLDAAAALLTPATVS